MGLLDDILEAAKRQYAEGAPYREAVGGLLSADIQPMKQLLTKKTYVNPMTTQEGIDAALNYAPMGLGVVKNVALNEAARKHFGTTFFPKETGYILDDGTRLDFTGRHESSGYRNVADRFIPEPGKPDYLKNERVVDHRQVAEITPDKPYGWDSLSNFIDQTGAVRYMPETGVSMVHTNKPSPTQIQKIVNDFRKSGDPLLMDIDHFRHGENLASKEFLNPSEAEVTKWIEQQYKKLQKIK